MSWLWTVIKAAAGAWLAKNGKRYAKAAVTVGARRARAYAVRKLGEAAAGRADAFIRRTSGGRVAGDIERLEATKASLTKRINALCKLYGTNPPPDAADVMRDLGRQLSEVYAVLEAAQ
jgi:hypothetical protein